MSQALMLFITEALKIIPLIMQAGIDIAPFVKTIIETVKTGSDPTAEAWFALKQAEVSLRSELQA